MVLRVKAAEMTAVVNGTERTVKILVIDDGFVPEGEDVSISFDGATAKITGLASVDISYNGTTAEIGG